MDKDTIYRQDAIDLFPNDDLIWDTNCGYIATHFARRMIKELPSAQPKPHWIQCDEKMPEEKDAGILKKLGIEKKSEYVLVTVEVKDERITATACTYNGKWNWDMKYAYPDFKVVAWMPLPEPYREGQE